MTIFIANSVYSRYNLKSVPSSQRIFFFIYENTIVTKHTYYLSRIHFETYEASSIMTQIFIFVIEILII